MSALETATLQDGRTVRFHPDPIGEGGMKVVHFTEDRRHVLAFMKDQTKDPNRVQRLEKIVGVYNPTVPHAEGGAAASQEEADFFARLFCWPNAIVTAPRFGVMAPTYSGDFFFASGPWKGQEKQGRWFASPKLRRAIPAQERGNFLSYLQISIQMARALGKMHLSGLAHSDLSPKNILVDPTKGQCAVIDVDGLVVPKLFPPDVLGTPGYIAPEVIKTQHLDLQDTNRRLPCVETDLHALPTLIYEYLLRRHPLRGPKVHSTASPDEDEKLSMGSRALFIEHPHDTSNRPNEPIVIPYTLLGKYLAPLFEQAFIEGLHEPSRRPSAVDWERALVRTTDLLIPCGNASCEESWFIHLEGHPVKCPHCGWRAPRSLPLLHLYRTAKGSVYSENHYVTAFEHRHLLDYHADAAVNPGPLGSKQMVARVVIYQNQWVLVNEALEKMISPTGNPVPKGQAVVLQEGSEIILNQAEKGRMVRVEMAG